MEKQNMDFEDLWKADPGVAPPDAPGSGERTTSMTPSEIAAIKRLIKSIDDNDDQVEKGMAGLARGKTGAAKVKVVRKPAIGRSFKTGKPMAGKPAHAMAIGKSEVAPTIEKSYWADSGYEGCFNHMFTKG